MARECKLGVACGKKGIGKTYITNQVLQEYVQGGNGYPPRRVLIIDVNDEYEQYRAIAPTRHREILYPSYNRNKKNPTL